MSKYVSNNGVLIAADEYSIKSGNRAHLYGDGLFETIRVINGKAINLQNHIARLLDGMKALRLKIPTNFDVPFFEREMQVLLTKNHIVNGGKIRLSIDRRTGGTYLPLDNSVDYFIEAFELESNAFKLNESGLSVDLFDELKKQINPLSPYKTKNCLIYIIGRIKAQELGMDDLLIQNEKLGIIESTSSNLFIVSNGVLYTPGIDLGCLGGTMRMQIINLAIKRNIKVYECNISPQNLLAADEVFFTNAVNGITWVTSYRTKTYTNVIAQQLIEYLNEEWGL